MGLKKYEIITVGSDKRVRALRSWQVGDRYVNIGDVGGIVYDEKTLSQDGACWLFKGNFGFPGARIGGDSIVDVGEATLSAAGAPNVDILGSSVLVGSKLQFASEQTAADAVVLTAADFEQGDYLFVAGAKAENQKVNSPAVVRIKNPIFMGGVSKTLKIDVPGYAVQAFGLDADLDMVNTTANTVTGAGVTLSVPAAQYCLIRLRKDPIAATVPADATSAQITFTGSYETKLSIIDSRVEINPANSTKISSIKPGGRIVNGSYPEAIIRNSKMSVNASAAAGATVRLMGQIIESNVTINATAAEEQISGIYSNVKNLMPSGSLSSGLGSPVYNAIQATDCDNFVTSPGVFPGYATSISANMPFIFQGCNVPNGLFYHHARIANTYRDINFDLATADLGKPIGGDKGKILVSSEVNGMYRGYGKSLSLMGTLIESAASVEKAVLTINDDSYATTIYKDAFLSGIFTFAGTNVFGNKVRSHPLAQVLNVQPRAVQGQVNATSTGQTITGVVPNAGRVTVPKPFRINSSQGLSLAGIPAGIDAVIFFTTFQSVITGVAASTGNTYVVPASRLPEYMAYVTFRKTDGSSLTVDEIAGVTVTVYNGCKIVNTGATAVNMKGNIRVEDNATLIDTSVTGTGYFGGNAVASGLQIGGAVFMSDNASFVKTGGSANIRNLKMTENARAIIGDVVITGSVHIKDNAVFTPTNLYVAEADFYLQDNAKVTSDVSVNGSLLLKDDAAVNRALTIVGCITLCGSYNQTAAKTWTGKRVIDNENAPTYDDNVKTKYDF